MKIVSPTIVPIEKKAAVTMPSTTGSASMVEGADLIDIAQECVRRHADAYGDAPVYQTMLDVGGVYGFRLRGEDHAWTPQAIASLQHAARGNMRNLDMLMVLVNSHDYAMTQQSRYRWHRAPSPKVRREKSGTPWPRKCRSGGRTRGVPHVRRVPVDRRGLGLA